MFQFYIIEISFVDTKYFEEIFGMENIIIDLQKGKDVAPATPLENQILKKLNYVICACKLPHSNNTYGSMYCTTLPA